MLESSLLTNDVHWNENGHELMAAIIGKYIRKIIPER